MTRIYILRHGQTDWNKNRQVQGHANTSLNESGIIQAEQIRSEVEKIHFDKIFCSPLDRAQQTLKIVLPNVEYEVSEQIIERDFGDFEGKEITSFDYTGFWNYGKSSMFNTGEKIEDFQNRINSFIYYLKEEYKDKTVLLVCHGGVIMTFYAFFKGIPEDGDYLKNLTQNGQLIHFEIE